MAKITREKFKTYQNVFDNFTLRNIFKLSSQGYFEELKSPISIGKEANVFSAVKKDGSLVAVKIYRLENCDFNRMYDYIRTDPRFSGIKSQRRKIVFEWTKREFKNLLKAREAGVRVPTPYTFLSNILVLEYIGTNEKVADKLKDANIKDPEKYFNKCVDYVKKLYKADIIHGDLSSFNILDLNNNPVFIDMSQGTTLKDPNVLERLRRDIKNLCSYFKKQGVETDEEGLYSEILKLDTRK